MRSRWWLLRHEFCIQDRNYDIGFMVCSSYLGFALFFFFFFFNHVGLFGGDISFFNHDMFMIWLIFHLLDSINVIKGFLEDKSKKSLEIVFFFKIYKFMVYYSLFIFSMPKWDLWLEMLRIIVYQEFDSFFYIYISPEDLSFTSFGIKKIEWRTIYTRGHFNYSLFLCLKLYLSMFQKYI